MRYIYCFILLLSFNLQIQAQPYYFLQNNETYVPLSGSTSVNGGTLWSGFQTWSIPIGFTFAYMNTSFTSVDLEATGRLIFDVNHYYFADMFVAQGLSDKGTSSSLSPISYKLSGPSGNQILKIEISNAKYSGDVGSTINFQIWLYEYTSRLELHMGAVTITNASNAFGAGPMSGVYRVTNWSPTTYGYGHMQGGNPVSPTENLFSGTGVNTALYLLTNAPSNGQVYTYTTDTSFLSLEKNSLNAISIYPNPTEGIFYLAGIEIGSTLKLVDVQGRIVKEFLLNESVNSIDISNLEKGIYFVQVSNSDDLNLRTTKICLR